MATKEDCIRAAVRAGATSDEARDLVNRLFSEREAMRQAGHAVNAERELARRALGIADEERLQKLRERKQTALIIRRRAEVDSAIHAMSREGASFSEALEALTAGSHKKFAGSRESVASRASAIQNEWKGGMLNELSKIEGAMELLHRDEAFGRLVHREMLAPGSTQDAAARGVADIFYRRLETMRRRSNDAGSNIGKLDNYAPQSHNERRMLKAGEEQWAAFVSSRLDWERSFPGITDPAQRRELLGEIFQNIVTGQGRRISARERHSWNQPTVLKGDVKPSRIEGRVLYQSAPSKKSPANPPAGASFCRVRS